MMDERPVLLLVDDQPTNLKALAALLQQDYQIKVATNGADALILAAALRLLPPAVSCFSAAAGTWPSPTPVTCAQ